MIELTETEFIEFVNYMHKYYGIDLSKKRQLIEGRMSNMIERKGMVSFSEYLKSIKNNHKEEIIEMVNRLTTNYTYFYREEQHFEYLRDTLLKEIEKTSQTKTLNIWSAGCASGEEPYTIAMVLDEYFGYRKINWKINIKATDISEQVLKQAREGIYMEDVLKHLPVNYKSKYFTKVDGGKFRVNDDMRKYVTFGNLNLIEPLPNKNKYDVIFCRNVMIYFNTTTKEMTLNKFYEANKKGGYLMIGHSESVQRDKTEYKYIKPAIYKKE